jgi:hypothetical protein
MSFDGPTKGENMKNITLILNADQLNVVMAGLYELPQKVARATTDLIVNQVNLQQQPPQQPPADQPAAQ